MIKYIFRMPGENPMLETRRESKDRINVKLRRAQVIKILKSLKVASAREIAEAMYVSGYTVNTDRNNAAPRLNELVKTGQVEPVGKKYDSMTGRNVTVFKLRKGVK